MSTKLRVNDTVKVLAGKDKGKTGQILKIDRENGRVMVQGIGIVKKTFKPRSEQDQGGIREVESYIDISNVAYVLKSGETTRLGYEFDKNGKKVRVAKKTGDKI